MGVRPRERKSMWSENQETDRKKKSPEGGGGHGLNCDPGTTKHSLGQMLHKQPED